MKAILTLVCCALAGVTFAQQPAPPDSPTPLSAAPEVPQAPQAGPASAHLLPSSKESLQVRVRRILDNFDQRHQQRMLEMSSYDKVGDVEPAAKRFADPRKVQLEIKDEQDREQTSKALAKEYADEARQVQNQEQALQDFIAKRQKTLDDLSKRAGANNRQDLEVAAANLAREAGTEAQVSEIRRRLADSDRAAEELSARQSQDQQETASVEEEMKKLQTLEQSLQKETKAYRADAASARENQLHLADRLDFYLVNAQAEDVLDQDTKATEAAPHLAASPEIHDTLESMNPSEKADAKPDAAKKCAETPNDDKGCPDKPAPEAKE